MNAHRVVGPPGTGKTTYLKRNVDNAAERYGPERVVVSSLTRAAAATVAMAAPGIPADNIGTLHSLAFRAIGATSVAEARVDEFNEFCERQCEPAMRLTGRNDGTAESSDEDVVETSNAGATTGDKNLADLNRYRARMVPVSMWPDRVAAFASIWNRFKVDVGAPDFTDLLEQSLQVVDRCPGNPAALFLDESQDFSALAFALARKWGSAAEMFVHVGDPDQILYEWAGVDPHVFTADNLPPENSHLLRKSWRVPRAVHEVATAWIERTPGRAPVPYEPRDFDGFVRRDLRGHVDDVDFILDDAEQRLAENLSVMFCASCSYMLEPIIERLRERGIPFHNPYRTKRGDWNPLRRGGRGVSAIDRLYAFCRIDAAKVGAEASRFWTWSDAWAFIKWIESRGTLRNGAKSDLEKLAKARPDERCDANYLLNCFVSDEHRGALLDADLTWFASVIPEDRRRQLRYPYAILEKYGSPGIRETPRVVVTTIHGVKGGEADVVYLFPDLSPQAAQEWAHAGPGREGVRRAYYVGMTRARVGLVLCKSASNCSVQL